MSTPTTEHLMALKRLLGYLKHTIHRGIHIQPASNHTLYAYIDVDWAGSVHNRKSTGGYYIFLGPILISWSSKKQQTIGWSNTI